MCLPRRLPVSTDVNIGAGFNPWGTQRPLKWWDTAHLVEEEREMIEYVRERGSAKLWTMLGDLSRRNGRKHKYQSRSYRQKIMAVFTRLTKEEKLVRHRTTNLVELGMAFLEGAERAQAAARIRLSESGSRSRGRPPRSECLPESRGAA
jgi:hypothetical protein